MGEYQPTAIKHPVLRRLFPEATTLENAILLLPSDEGSRAALKAKLFRRGDSQMYRFLLKKSVAAPIPAVAAERVTVDDRDSHHDVVCKVAQRLKRCHPENVLLKPSMESGMKEVSTEEWVQLHARIGSIPVFHLLRGFFVFAWQPGGGPLLQVAGHPIDQLVKSKQYEDMPTTRDETGAQRTAVHISSEGPGDSTKTDSNARKRSRREPKWVRKAKKRKLETEHGRLGCMADRMDVDTAANNFPDNIMSKEKDKGGDWEALGGPPSQVVFLRSAIFYNTTGVSGSSLPKTHILHELKDRHGRGGFLYASIFRSKAAASAVNVAKAFSKDSIPRMPAFVNPKHQRLVALLKKSIDRFQKCRLGALLNLHCPLPWKKAGANPETESYSTADLINEWTPCGNVVAYLWGVLRKIFPPELLGDYLNRKALRKTISKFVGLNRFDTMNLNQATHGLSSKGMPWLEAGKNGSCPVSLAKSHQRMMAQWTWWLFAEVIIPCLRCSFYCTESEARKQDVLYFRKEVWHKMRQEALSDLKSTLYEPIASSTALSVLKTRGLGFAKLRFKPKKTALRPIVQMGLPTKLTLPSRERQWSSTREWIPCSTKEFKPVNFFLRNAYAVVKYECSHHRKQAMATSTTDYDSVYKTLQPQLTVWKFIREKGCQQFRPYIISCDVSRAFDNVDINRLKNLVRPLFSSPNYQILNHAIVVASMNGLLTSYQRQAKPFSPQNSMYRKWEKSCGPQTVAVKQKNLECCSRDEVRNTVLEHLGNNLLCINDQWYRQKRGIPAGSILSPIFCSLFLADVEAEQLVPILEQTTGSSPVKDHAMARIVDDFLFIVFSRRRATRLLEQLTTGIGDCVVNPEKFQLNFDATVGGRQFIANTHTDATGASFVPWCGLLVNSATLEIQADYRRYIGVKMKSTVSVPLWKPKPGQRLLARLCMHVRIKCHPLLLDTSINSPTTVRVNVYQMLLLCAIKFHCYVSALPVFPRGAMLLSCIHGMIKYLIYLIKRRMRKAQKKLGRSDVLQTCSPSHTQWLGLKAFSWVLKKKKVQYREVLQLLDAEMSSNFYRRMASQLKEVVDESKSFLFTKMKI